MAATKYLDFRSKNFSLGTEIAIWAHDETVKNEFPEASSWSTTDLILVTSELSPNIETVYHDDEQRRSGSRSKREPIKGRRNHGSVDVEGYVRPSGTVGSKPQMAILYKGVFGAERVVDSGTLRNISAVTAATRAATSITVPAGMYTNLVAGDAITYKSNNTSTAENEAEIRFIATLDGSNTITVAPGWRVPPVVTGTADQVQGAVTYKLGYEYTSTRSLLMKDGYLSHQLVGSAVEGITETITGTDPLKNTFQIGFRQKVTCGTDQVRGDGAGNDTFLTSSTTLTVGDATVFEVGDWVNIVATLLSSGADTTETAALITAINYTTNVVTFTRGSSPVSVTGGSNQLMADVTSSAAGPYDTTTAYNLDVNIDYQGWTTLDVDDGGAHGAGLTRAVASANLNKQLFKDPKYGFNVVGGVDVFWGKADGTGVFTDATTGIKASSPFWGSQSSIQFRASASNSAHTLLGFTVGETIPTHEVRVVPWTPTISAGAETGRPIHGYAGWLNWNGYRLGITQMEFNLNNNVKWLEEEKRNDDLPSGFIAGSTRTVEVTVSGYFYGEVPRLFYAAANDVQQFAVIQCGKTRGYCSAWNLKTFKVANPQISGDEERTYQLTLRVYASSALEDETGRAFA